MIQGEIKFQNKVVINKRECFGRCKVSTDHFQIAISKAAGESLSIFAEVLLHELLHLWLFVIEALTKKRLSDRQHHRIINQIIPTAVKVFEKYHKED
jgi:hypothetical protein